MMKKVCIVIPIYKETLDDFEILSIQQLNEVLGYYPIIIVHPEKVNPNYLTKLGLSFTSKCFKDDYFNKIYGYNKLLLAEEFYQTFEEYEYMLIHQTDVYVFKDDLSTWCDKKYDYIGPPWMCRQQNKFHKTLDFMNNCIRKIQHKNIKTKDHLLKVGNGGFSLRKIQPFINICKKHKHFIENNIVGTPENFVPEDIFWSLQVPYPDTLKIPNYKEALAFGFDRRPKLAFKANNNELPFGVHGIDKRDRIKFYKTIIPNL